jgi:hypothetical protein
MSPTANGRTSRDEHDQATRVPGFPDGAHGDLPHRDNEETGATYDENQRGAVLLACVRCLRSYFVTKPDGWRECASCH